MNARQRRRGRLARAWAAALPAAAAILVSACMQGSETGNPTKGLSGTMLGRDGRPSAGARVVLVPAGYVPADAAGASALPAAVTDASGHYRFERVAEGRYNLEALNPADGTRARLAGIETSEGVRELPDQILRLPGSIAAALAGAADTLTGFIYVPGSTYRAPVRASASEVRLDSLPPGFVDSLVYGSAAPGGAAPRAFAWGVRVAPDSVSKASGPYLAWRRSAALAFDAGPGGAAITADLTGFPLRVALPDSVLAAARADGSDLRAANEHGSPLPCEIQKGPKAGAPAALWVRLDTVFAGKPTRLRLFWDYAGSEPVAAPKAGGVFPPSDGYAGAWHLDEDPSANGGRMADASGQGNEGTAVGFGSAGGGAAGIAGGAVTLDGRSQFMTTRLPFNDPEAFTILAWFRADSSAGGRLFEFADKDSGRASYWDRLLHLYADGTVHFGLYPPDTAGKPMPTRSTYKILGTADAYDDGAWHQAAARLSPKTGQALFIDGERIANDPGSRSAQIIKGYWRLGYGQLSGWGPAGTGEYFQGALDEFWAVHAALPDDFVKLSFQNLKPGSRLIIWP